jgi:hypothetical protein
VARKSIVCSLTNIQVKDGNRGRKRRSTDVSHGEGHKKKERTSTSFVIVQGLLGDNKEDFFGGGFFLGLCGIDVAPSRCC